MHFSRLRLTGFKSFVEATEVRIEPGMTGVVGPNGCGKSNLVEALRWVMGESSAKQMRGGEMDDVIFGGTTERPARNLAEVILTFDNADRSAPSLFNDSDEIDVSRRIERGSGSAYRVNGREVRARDVQTLFADVSSGARSTALVSQGRIGAIINAKPADRRHLLEEAAGIGGLHSRRHEAELRLRAAETNLERLDDLLGALEEQHKGLKRQARQATRYRNLSDHIRRAEAILLHLRWTEARDRRQAAQQELQRAEDAVAESTRLAAAASARQAEAAADVPERRRAEAETAAALQRLLVARDALEAEERRLEATRQDLAGRLAQIASDIDRERSLQTDASDAATRLQREIEAVRTAQAGEPEALQESARRTEESAIEVGALEQTITDLTRALAADESRQAELNRRVAEFGARRVRLVEQQQAAEQDNRRSTAEAGDDERLSEAQAATRSAREALDQGRLDLQAAEQIRAASHTAEGEAREAFQAAEAEAGKLRAEAAALSELLQTGDPDLWPPMIDAVSVEPGYGVALGAALGDDLVAPADEAAPIHWRSLPPLPDAAPLPQGVRPLADFVTGPSALQRRLSQIGVVEDETSGAGLGDRLLPGQRLVSKSGALWRWDGLTAVQGSAGAATNRLAQRTRLKDLRSVLPPFEARAQDAKARLERAIAVARDADACEREGRDGLWNADREFQQARDAETAAAQADADARARVEATADTIARLTEGLAELDRDLDDARDELARIPNIGARREASAEHQHTLVERRASQAEHQREHDRLNRESDARRQRLQVIDDELGTWHARARNAEQQMGELGEREDAASDELRRLEARPAEIAAQRSALIERITVAESDRDRAADTLAEGEARLEAIGRELRAAETKLGEQREDRVRRQAAVEQIGQELSGIAERVRERIGCEPEQALDAVGVSADDDLPEHEKIETRLERLFHERDNMGPVNLRAESEAAELNERITTMQTEREDLVGAIARLRQGIANLNREGRGRLMAAFNEVDRHFRTLFTQLFGGGRAHLSLTEAEDPFEAGLEIMASPPGKRLTVMSLLSGGEQALTALALLFAVFQTNPAPICVLDEVDAPLDDHNVDRFCTMLDEIARSTATRFLLVTHHRLTMARMDRLYGVTMAEHGVSQLVSVDLQTAEGMRETA